MKPKTTDQAKMNKAKQSLDYFLFLPVLVLMGLGLIMVMSSSGIIAERSYGYSYYFFQKQAFFVLLGLGCMYLAWRIPLKYFYKTVYIWLFGSIVLLLLTFSPLGVEAGGARRWLQLEIFFFQPLELAKIGLVLYLAYYFSSKQDKIKTFSVGFLPPIFFTACIAGLLLLQPDFGGAVFIAGIFFFMSLVGGTRFFYLIISSLLGSGLAIFMILQSPYRLNRWLAFLHPFQNSQDVGYQVVQSLYGLGVGHIFGVGLGAGRQKLFFLPAAHTDFILAVLGEELGFIGISVVFICIGIVLFRSFFLTVKINSLQDRFTAFGMSLLILMGALMNIAVVLGAVPPKGLPMPFISYGGSNLIIMSICMGILLNVSKNKA